MCWHVFVSRERNLGFLALGSFTSFADGMVSLFEAELRSYALLQFGSKLLDKLLKLRPVGISSSEPEGIELDVLFGSIEEIRNVNRTRPTTSF